MKEWSLKHAVRLSAFVASVAPLAVTLLDTLPWKPAVSLSAVVLAAGEVAQRVEDMKTQHASRPTPDE